MDSSYLGEREDDARGPRHRQHDFAFPFGLADPQRVQNGWLSVQTNDHSYKGARVHGHQLHEHQQPAGEVPRLPLHCDVPRRVHGHHDESDQQVRHGQVHDQDPDVGLALATFPGGPQHQQIADGGHCAQGEGDDYADFGGRGEGGQLQRVSVSALVTVCGGSQAAAIHRLIRQVVEHNEAQTSPGGNAQEKDARGDTYTPSFSSISNCEN